MQEQGVKRAALKLHAMPEHEQLWFLDQLPQYESERLTAALQDIQRHGLVNDQSLIHDALAHVTGGSPHSIVTEEASNDVNQACQIINSTSVSTIVDLLSKEPPWVISLICHYRHWLWYSEVMALMSLTHGIDIKQISSPDCKQTIRDTVIEEFAYLLEHFHEYRHTNKLDNDGEIFSTMSRRQVSEKPKKTWWKRIWR